MTTIGWTGELTALESKADVDSLNDLHARRRALLEQLAPLKALHGPFGTWDAKRKQLLEALKIRHRGECAGRGEKVTEGLIDALAHADTQYDAFLDASTRDKTEYLLLDNEYQELNERVRNREFSILAYNAETRLGQ